MPDPIYEPTPYGPIAFDPIECQACGESIRADQWIEHARTHNPSAYREGWPCKCRVGRPCRKHRDADWLGQ